MTIFLLPILVSAQGGQGSVCAIDLAGALIGIGGFCLHF
jgi:hypothetical protein